MKSRVNVITSLLILAAFLTIADTNIVFGQLPPLPTLPIEADIMEVSPDKISHQDDLPDTTITLELELPEDSILVEDDFKDASLMIIASEWMWGIDDIAIEAILQDVTFDVNEIQDVNDIDGTTITTTKTTVTIIATFDTDKLMDKLPEDYHGTLDLDVEGWLESGETLLGYAVDVITIVQAKDYISKINLDQIWDYGDPIDSTDLMYEFRLEMYPGGDHAADIDEDILEIDFLTPAGQTFDILKKDNKWSNPLEYKVRSANSADLQAYSDGEYTITLHLGDGMQVQTTAWFGNPYTKRPILQPTQEPVLTSELQQQPEGSLVTFNWEPCDDSNVDDIYINMTSTYNNGLGDKLSGFDFDQTSWGPVLLLEGSWQAELIFCTFTPNDLHWQKENDDGINVGVAKSSRCRYRITVEDSPWNIYEVWGGNERLSMSDYLDIDKLLAYGYEPLGQSDGFETFSGPFDYYLIATMGQCFIDSIQGSDGLFYDLDLDEVVKSNISEEDNLSGEPDEQCAILGSGKAPKDYGYNGLFVFDDPNNWKMLTVYASDRNLNLDKSLVSVSDEKGNIKNPDDIAPNDIITYGITFDTNDFLLNVKDEKDVKNEKVENNKVHNIKVVDILSEHVIFEGASTPDNNEVTESYDPIAHTYTRQYPTVDPEKPKSLRLIVKVAPTALPGTTITNFVTIDSDQTPPSTARSMDLTIPYEPLNITTRTINSAGNEIDWIESGKNFIYQICFDNNSNGPQVENVVLIDELPPEVTFVSAQDDNGNLIGNYDPQNHSYTVVLDALEPGSVICLDITVKVNEDTPGTIINNVATIGSNETPQVMAEVVIEVKPPLEAELIITPDILRRNGTSQYITAVVKFPAGIQQSEIDPENIPELYYQDRDTGDFIFIGYGSRPVLSGTQITTLFNRAELMDAIYGYGEYTLAVVGQLKSSQTFYGEDTILITKFTGD